MINWEIIKEVVEEANATLREDLVSRINIEEDNGSGLISKSKVIEIIKGAMQ
jgi:hypothetical protein